MPGCCHHDHDPKPATAGHAHGHGHDHHHSPDPRAGAAQRRVLWAALWINAAMFVIEIGSGLAWRARAALVKAASMALFGVAVLAYAAWGAWQGSAPEPATMGLVAALALAANLGSAALLYAYRDGDANMRSVWLCTRNDAIGNVAVGLAALGVFGTGSRWPDLVVAALMASLALSAAVTVLRHARAELAHAPA